MRERLMASLLLIGCSGSEVALSESQAPPGEVGVADGGSKPDGSLVFDGGTAPKDGGHATKDADSSTNGKDDGGSATVAFTDVDKLVKAELKKQEIPGVAIGIAKNGVVRYLSGYGHADAGKETPVDPKKTLFRWASISKTLAGVVLAQLVDEGTVKLEANIETYYSGYEVPKTWLFDCKGAEKATFDNRIYDCKGDRAEVPIPSADRKITLGQLSAHTAGIQHYDNGQSDPNPPLWKREMQSTNTGMEWALEYFVAQPLVAIPGKAYSYSTFGANLAGVVMEKATKKSFDALVSTRIANKVGLSTLEPDYGWDPPDNLASGYAFVKGVRVEVPKLDNSWKLAGGGYRSTVEDLTKYCASFSGTTLMSNAQKTLAWKEQTTKDGAGHGQGLFFDLGTRGGRSYVGHSGENSWTETKVRYFKDDGLCIAVMANLYGANVSDIVNGIEDAVRAAGL